MNVKLLVIAGEKAGMEIPVSTPEFLIGRGEHCHLQLAGESIGLRHCAISVAKVSVGIEDCGSGKDTLLNGKELRWRRELHDGDRITVGALVLEVRLDTAEGGEKRQQVRHGQDTVAGKVAATATDGHDADVLEWVEHEDERQERDATGHVASPLADSAAVEGVSEREVTADTPTTPVTEGQQEEGTPQTEAGRAWDGTDLLLMAAAGVLSIVILVFLAPMVWGWCFGLWRTYGWPWWAWIVLGVVMLGVAIVLHARQNR